MGSYSSQPALPQSRVLPILLLELMAWCWEENPELRPSVCQVLDALKMPEYLRLQTALDLHSKLHPKCLTVWKGDPCNQQDARPQSNIVRTLQPLPSPTCTSLHSFPSILHYPPRRILALHKSATPTLLMLVNCGWPVLTFTLVPWLSGTSLTAILLQFRCQYCQQLLPYLLILSSHSANDA